MADLDAALRQQVFDVAQRKRAPNVHHNRQADDLRTGLEVPEGGTPGHLTRLGGKVSPLREFALTAPNLPVSPSFPLHRSFACFEMRKRSMGGKPLDLSAPSGDRSTVGTPLRIVGFNPRSAQVASLSCRILKLKESADW